MRRVNLLIKLFLLLILLSTIVLIYLPKLKSNTQGHDSEPVEALISVGDKLNEAKKKDSQGNITSKNILSADEMYNPENWHAYSKQIKEKLLNGKVSSVENMRSALKNEGKKADFSGRVYKIGLSNGILAVFKTTADGKVGKNQMEAAAFDLSVATGIGYIPPTIIRELTYDFDGDGISTKLGFLSLFVKTKIDLLALNKSQFYELLDKINREDIANFKIFNFVFGNYDAGPHNMLVYERNVGDQALYYPILIDNEEILRVQKVRYGESPFVCWLKYGNTNDDGEFDFDSAKESTEATRRDIKNIAGWRPPSRPHNFVLFDGFYWAQFTNSYFNSPDYNAEFLYPEFLPKTTKEALSELTVPKIFEILGTNEASAGEWQRNQVAGIIERRDMLFSHFP